MNEKDLNSLDSTIVLRIFDDQLKEIRTNIKKYPDIWNNESQFIRCAISYFLRHIKTEKFKIIME